MISYSRQSIDEDDIKVELGESLIDKIKRLLRLHR